MTAHTTLRTLAATLALACLVAPSVGSAQERADIPHPSFRHHDRAARVRAPSRPVADGDVTITGDGWEVYVDGTRCADPCRVASGPTAYDVGVGEPGSQRPTRHGLFAAREAGVLHVGHDAASNTPRVLAGIGIGVGTLLLVPGGGALIGLAAYTAQDVFASTGAFKPVGVAMWVLMAGLGAGAAIWGLAMVIGGIALLTSGGGAPRFDLRRATVMPTVNVTQDGGSVGMAGTF